MNATRSSPIPVPRFPLLLALFSVLLLSATAPLSGAAQDVAPEMSSLVQAPAPGAHATGQEERAEAMVPSPKERSADTANRAGIQSMADFAADDDFIEIIRRDEGLPNTPPTGYVPDGVQPDTVFTIQLDEGLAYLGNGVMYDGFRTNGTIPGPTLRVTEGDIVEIRVENTGSMPHGASIHAAYTATSKYLADIRPGETSSVTFRATYPGVFMYHCAPGGHAIPMHVMFGQYGMIVVEPKDQQYKLEEELGHGPDLEMYVIQNELYTSGKDAVEENARYVTFNGEIFRYATAPITAKPGDYVRLYFLNVGPNLLSTFHIVGIIWDYVYWQGHPEARMPGGQTVTAGPADSWVIEFRVPPDEGGYTMLSHAVGSTSTGAIGKLIADRNADTPKTVLADGPAYTEDELQAMMENGDVRRVISPFKPGSPDVDRPVRYGSDTEEVIVQIKGNSFSPKIIDIEPGTKVTWINEDVFTAMAGEQSGAHNVATTSGPERFGSPMLGHAESWSYTFEAEGTYDYMCTPHPYMKGQVVVRERSGGGGIPASIAWALLPALLALGVSVVAWRRTRTPAENA